MNKPKYKINGLTNYKQLQSITPIIIFIASTFNIAITNNSYFLLIVLIHQSQHMKFKFYGNANYINPKEKAYKNNAAINIQKLTIKSKIIPALELTKLR